MMWTKEFIQLVAAILLCIPLASSAEHARTTDPKQAFDFDGFMKARDNAFGHMLGRNDAFQKLTRDIRERATKTPITKVGIIGAGPAGLYAATLLQSIGIPYEILESREQDRIGGRVWTYKFNKAKWDKSKPGDPEYYDYYDVGAMRLPIGSPWQDRLIGSQNFSVMNYVNHNPLTSSKDHVNLINYPFDTGNNTLYFNNILKYKKEKMTGDPFRVGERFGGNVQNKIANQDQLELFSYLTKKAVKVFDTSYEAGYQNSLKYDNESVRSYLRDKRHLSNFDVDWVESINTQSILYDTSMAQAIIEQWTFESANWRVPNGGMDRLPNGLWKLLKTPVLFNTRVRKIDVADNGDIRLHTMNKTNPVRTYSHVINTAPFGAIFGMDMNDPKLGLNYNAKLAFRELTQNDAFKVGVKFKSRWWENDHIVKYANYGGESNNDLPIRRIEYPPYGIKMKNAAAVLQASYVWGQDATRMAAYINTPELMKDIVLDNLAYTHNVSLSYLESQYISHFAHSWGSDPNSVGGITLPYPGQLVSIQNSFRPPSCKRLYFAGDMLSSGHGWIVGALNSGYRAVTDMLSISGHGEQNFELCCKWGWPDEMVEDYVYANPTRNLTSKNAKRLCKVCPWAPTT